MSSLAEFNRQVEEFASKLLPEQLRLLQQKIAFLVLKGVVETTPVDTGRARANWQLTINEPASGEVPIGSDPLATADNLQALGFFQVVYITNNVPYIVFLEEGSSQRAPEGMVEVTFRRLLSLFQRVDDANEVPDG